MDSNELQSLLATLRATQDVPATRTEPQIASYRPPNAHSKHKAALAQANDVDSILGLLKRIQDPAAANEPDEEPPPAVEQAASTYSPPLLPAHDALSDHDMPSYEPTPSKNDRSQMTFAESLPILTSLCVDETFVEGIEEMQAHQRDWELRSVDERNRLQQDVAKGLRSRTDLQTLDRRILDEFDKLKVAQQAQLQQLRVPAFQVTHDAVLLERQRRILETLEGMLSD